jgi:STE24 endopeptidase
MTNVTWVLLRCLKWGRHVTSAEHGSAETLKGNSGSTAPAEPSIDPERQAKARAFARDRYRLLAIDLFYSFALVAGFLVTGASEWLKTTLLSAGPLRSAVNAWGQWPLTAVYVAVLFTAYTVAMLPLSWWSGFVLPHRYGMSNQTPRGLAIDEIKSFCLGLLLGVPVAVVIYALLARLPSTWWIWASVLLVVLQIVMSYIAPLVIVPLFNKLVPLNDPDLTERISRLAAATGVRIAGVFTIDLSARTRAANAMVMGLGRTKRIALGDTLYADFTHDEIETIIAHELGHDVHHDLELGLVLNAVFVVCGMYVAYVFLNWGVAYFGFAGLADVAALPLLVLAAGVFSLILMPVTNALSRWRESLADSYSLRVTGKPRAFAAAMIRLANQNLAQVDPPRWIVWLLYSHPPIAERMRMAERFGRER